MLRPGTILLVQGGESMEAAVAVELESGAVRANTAQGDQRLPFDRIVRATSAVVSGSPRSPAALSEARDYVLGVLALAERANMHVLWELACELAAETPSVDDTGLGLGELAELGFGQTGHVALDAMAVALLRDPIYFQAKRAGFSPVAARTVRSILSQRQTRDAAQRELAESVRVWNLRCEGAELGPEDAPAFQRGVHWLRDFALFGAESSTTSRAQDLLRALEPTRRVRVAAGAESEIPPGCAFDWLVRAGVWDENENLDVKRLGLDFPVSEAVLEQVARLQAEDHADRLAAALRAGRLDWRGRRSFAIDDPSTRDVDDAFTARFDGEAIDVEILIADPAEYIPAGSPIDQEARQRAATLYLPDRTLPMIPLVLSERLASLSVESDCFALLFRFRVDPMGGVSDFRMDEVVTRLGDRCTYAEVDARLTASDCDEELSALLEAAKRLRWARVANGALPLQQSEIKVYAHDGDIAIHCTPPGSPARELVAEMMIATGALTASYCWERGISAVYRWQASPDNAVPFDPERADDPVFIAEVLQHMRRAEITGEPRPHYGLGVDAYIQITSPLRRYADLAMQRQIKGYLRTGVAPMGERQILELLVDVEGHSSVYGRIERDGKRFWILRWLESHRDTELAGVAIRPVGSRWYVFLPAFGFAENVAPHRPLRVGEELRLRIKSVSARRDRLWLQLRE